MRLVVEREREISDHIAESTYKIKAELSNNAGKIVEVKLSKDFVNTVLM
jgi:DNA topoisomerase-1